jgi:hypothetical protein
VPVIAWLVFAIALDGCSADGRPASSDPTSYSSAPSSSNARSAKATSYDRRVTSLLASVINLLSRRPARHRNHYYAAGVWHTPGFQCWRCDIAPGAVAAELTHDHPAESAYRRLAIATFNTVISDHRVAGGSFGPPLGAESNDQLSTIAIANYLGIAYLELRPALRPATRRQWLAALQGAALWLEPRLEFYINGNDNLSETLAMYLAWRATGNGRFYSDYQRSWQFTIRPPGRRWAAYGLRYIRRPHRPDGADGAGYLTEAGTGRPGFDPHYTIIQSGAATILYALSHQARALRLLNLITNALLTRTKRSTLAIDVTGGSRFSAPSMGYLESPALAVLALIGGREDLIPLLSTQLTEVDVSFRNYANRKTDQNMVIGDFGSILLALHPPS